jgi:hypothetical protein
MLPASIWSPFHALRDKYTRGRKWATIALTGIAVAELVGALLKQELRGQLAQIVEAMTFAISAGFASSFSICTTSATRGCVTEKV